MAKRETVVLKELTATTGELEVPQSGDGYEMPVTLSGSSGVESAFEIELTVNQSGTAGYDCDYANVTETATGSGSNYLLRRAVGGVDKFSVDNAGTVTTPKVTSPGTLEIAPGGTVRMSVAANGQVNFSNQCKMLGLSNTWYMDANTFNFRTYAGGADPVVNLGGKATISTGFTVATLPSGTVGQIARVTDASSPSVGSAVSGGGAAAALCWYNGSNWTVMGV